MSNNWYVYSAAPIDLRWGMLPTVEDVITAINAVREENDYDWNSINPNNFREHFELAKHWAREKGWEGDFREEPRVFWLPDDVEMSYGFVWKQDNNGTTFVISPVPLPHLDD